MAALQDEILRATTGPTVNEGLSSHFGRTTSESLQDAERRWLNEVPQSSTFASIADMWDEFLPLSGSLNDRKLTYWLGQ